MSLIWVHANAESFAGRFQVLLAGSYEVQAMVTQIVVDVVVDVVLYSCDAHRVVCPMSRPSIQRFAA